MSVFAIMKSLVTVRALFFSFFFALPLLYLPDWPGKARWLRFIVLVCVVLLAVIYAGIQHLRGRRAPSKHPSLARAFICLLGLGMIVTWLVNVTSDRAVAYGGMDPEYLGYVSWGLFLGAGVVFRNYAQQQIFASKNLIVALPVLGLSLLYGMFYIFHGLKLPGLLYQPLALALYANLVVVLCLHTLKQHQAALWLKWLTQLTLLLAVLTVVFCQTRLGSMVLAANLIIWSFYGLQSKLKWRGGLLALAVMVVILPVVIPNYFVGFRAESVPAGLSYKAALYSHSVKPMASHYLWYGKGPATLPPVINNQNFVPADIAKSVGASYRFSANHDLFFDFSYFFGILAGLTLLVINVVAVLTYIRCKELFNLAYLLLFFVLLTSALFSVPSLELTPLYFIVLFGMFAGASNHQPGKRTIKAQS